MNGTVVSIFITSASGTPLSAVPEAHAVPGRGLTGDRYFDANGTFSKPDGPGQQLTLIESEALEGLAREYDVQLAPHETRRNVLTRNVALNHLVGREFRVGEVRARGVKLCEPCGHLEKLTRPGVKNGLKHRGGLRAEILSAGKIRPGDAIRSDPA